MIRHDDEGDARQGRKPLVSLHVRPPRGAPPRRKAPVARLPGSASLGAPADDFPAFRAGLNPVLEWPDRRRRPDPHLGCARAQPQGRLPRAAARRPDRHHRALGLRQVEPCLRHDLRRGPAPLRRVAVGLRAPVPGPDGQARRRLDRGPLAGDLDRPEDDLAQPALDGRHRHRDLRLPAPAVGADRPSALPQLRRADRRAVGRADRRPRDDARRGHPVHGARAGRARAQGRVQGPARGAARGGLHARQDRRRAAPARGARSSSTRSTSTTSRWSWTGSR